MFFNRPLPIYRSTWIIVHYSRKIAPHCKGNEMNHGISSAFKDNNKLLLDMNDADNIDVYLIRVPKGFDITKLNGSEFNAGEIKEIEVEIESNQLTSVYELSAFSGQGLNVSPLIKSGDTCTLGLPMKGFMSVNRSYRASLPASNDVYNVAPAARVVMPEGLRVRFQPFGAGMPFKQSSVKKKKKHNRRHSLETFNCAADVQPMKKRQKSQDKADTVQHIQKKHTNKQNRSYLIDAVVLSYG